MAEHERAAGGKHEEADRRHRTKQQDSKPLFDQSLAWDADPSSLTETPFFPRMEEHAAMLSNIPFAVQRNNFIMRLHQTYGNRYVQRLMESIDVQAKLTVSEPGDIYEQEADRVADEVTRALSSPVQRQEEEEEVQVAPVLQRQDEEEELLQGKPLVQRQEEEEEEVQMAPVLQHQEKEEIQAKPVLQLQNIPEEEELLQGKSIIQQQPEEEEELQTQPDESQLAQASDNIETRIDSARGGGQPLADNIHKPMEQAFKADFSDVRVHTDSEADALNQQLGARAFTTGQDVFFREGEYSPGSDSGRKLIAHELTHVVQQGIGRVSSFINSVIARPAGDAYRQERIERKETLREGHSNLFIQRAAADLVTNAGSAPKGAGQCHEAVLYWLIKAVGKKDPKQLLTRLRKSIGLGQITGNWMNTNIYTASVQMTQATLRGSLTAGDIVWTGGPGSPIHSMVVVAVNAAPGPVNIRGFNNFGTFGPPAPQLAYDNRDLDISANNLWHANDKFGGHMSQEPMYQVTYATAAAGLNAYLTAQGWTRSFWKGWHT
jgi:hypothetical protein